LEVCVIGAGYVGLATAAALANLGHIVICTDTDADKIARLCAGECPIREPDLPEALRHNLDAGRLTFTTDTPAAVRSPEVVFIAVGTPLDANGCADLSHLRAAALDIARALGGRKLIVNKSAIPATWRPGPAEQIARHLGRPLLDNALAMW
jgi:UDPglucose 6-dehydrogenase